MRMARVKPHGPPLASWRAWPSLPPMAVPAATGPQVRRPEQTYKNWTVMVNWTGVIAPVTVGGGAPVIVLSHRVIGLAETADLMVQDPVELLAKIEACRLLGPTPGRARAGGSVTPDTGSGSNTDDDAGAAGGAASSGFNMSALAKKGGRRRVTGAPRARTADVSGPVKPPGGKAPKKKVLCHLRRLKLCRVVAFLCLQSSIMQQEPCWVLPYTLRESTAADAALLLQAWCTSEMSAHSVNAESLLKCHHGRV